jgi:membrane protein
VFTESVAAEILFELLSIVAVVAVFTLIYGVIPNTKVKFRNALVAGAIAGTVFYLFQMLYFFVQRELGSYNAIYGVFAAIPLFLLWMQMSWQIVLYGGELSFGMQNVSSYEQERLSLGVSYDYRCKIMLASMVIILREYLDQKPGLASSETIAHELHLPIRIVRDVMHELERDGLIFFVESEKEEKVNNYVPAVDPHDLRFWDVVSSVTGHGIELKKGRAEAPLMTKVGEIYDRVRSGTTSLPENVYLIDLISNKDA